MCLASRGSHICLTLGGSENVGTSTSGLVGRVIATWSLLQTSHLEMEDMMSWMLVMVDYVMIQLQHKRVQVQNSLTTRRYMKIDAGTNLGKDVEMYIYICRCAMP